MNRRHLDFACEGKTLIGTLDGASGSTGLLIVSGGNEIRSGAHQGMARLAVEIAAAGYPVFRYDRHGIGDSEGENGGFLSSQADIAAATAAFRQACPTVSHIVAFGVCDAATSLALFGARAGIDRLVLANPWVIEGADDGEAADDAPLPSAAAIRSRYWQRLKDPKALLRLFTGQVDLGKLMRGLKKATASEEMSGLAGDLAKALIALPMPATILLATRDRTAQAFVEAWRQEAYRPARDKASITTETLDTASHSFATREEHGWLFERIIKALQTL